MSRDSLDPKPVFVWWLGAAVPIYMVLTLFVATLAQPPASSDPFGRLHLLFVPVANILPGTGVWDGVFGLAQAPADATNGGFRMQLIVAAVLVGVAVCCAKVAQRNRARNDSDARTVREEQLRERTRREMSDGRR